jgi:hypothetical protein
MYDEMYRLMYPITFFLETLEVKRKVFSRDELREVLATSCRFLTERASRESVESTHSDSTEGRAYSSVYSCSSSHPDCQSLTKLFNSDFDLITKDVIFSPTGLPLLKKWLGFQPDLEVFPKSVFLYEVSTSPESCFLSLSRKLPGIKKRNAKFTQTVLDSCVGGWIREFDFSKSVISGETVCLVLHILLERVERPISHLPLLYGECETEILVECTEDEFEEISNSHLEFFGKYIPEEVMEDRVKIRRVDSKYECLYSHVAPVRAFYDGNDVHLSFSCFESHVKKRVLDDDLRMTFGKASPDELIEKYRHLGLSKQYDTSLLQRSAWLEAFEPVHARL